MKPPSPLWRFWLRSSSWLFLTLAISWFLLQDLMLRGLYAGAQVAFDLTHSSVTVESTGDWAFHIPLRDSPPEVLRRIGSPRLDSLDFTAPAPDIAFFTLGLPIYLALALSLAPRRRGAPLLWGSLVQLGIGVISVRLFAELTAYGILARVRPDSAAWASWMREVVSYLLTNVIPYIAPVITLLWFHPDLQEQLFPRAGLRQQRVEAPE